MVKHFSIKYGNKDMSFQLSAPDVTSLPPEPSSILYYLKLNSGIGH